MTVLMIAGAVPTRRPAVSRRGHHDGHLLGALRRGDPAGAGSLVARYGDRAYRLAIEITRNALDAEETVQDAFWSAVRKIDTFRGESAFGFWVYRIVASAAYQKLRGRKNRSAEVSLDEVYPSFPENGQHASPITDCSATTDEPPRQTELRAALNAAMDGLPPEYRVIVIRRDVEGLSVAEVVRGSGHQRRER